MFDVPADKGVTRDITRTPGANERDAVWSPDGKYIAYISDRTGETEVWLQPSEGGEPIQLTENNDTYIRQLMWSPNSKKVLYTDRKNRIVEVDVNSKSKKLSCKTLKESFIQSITLPTANGLLIPNRARTTCLWSMYTILLRAKNIL